MATQWIDARESQPDRLVDVLVVEIDETGEPSVYMGYHNGRAWHLTGFETDTLTVTHWMPLPAPPAAN